MVTDTSTITVTPSVVLPPCTCGVNSSQSSSRRRSHHHAQPSPSSFGSATFATLAGLVYLASHAVASVHSLQIPFAPSLTLTASSSSFTSTSATFNLVHAVHLGTDRYPGLNIHHDFHTGESAERDRAILSTLHYPADTISLVSPPHSHSLTSLAVNRDTPLYPISGLRVASKKGKIWRPSHPARSNVYEAARHVQFHRHHPDFRLHDLASQLTWDQVDADLPDISDVETLATLAKMASNAYSTPKNPIDWYDVTNNTAGRRSYNLSSSFGWHQDGLRGHVFSSGPANESIIIAIKGTSGASGGLGSPTGRNDKLNDNLLFSCCCARVDWSWSPVCDCYSGQPNRCNLTCVEQALVEKSVYYPTATDLFNNITQMYPHSNIWLTGHSLGGSLASLLGITFGIPTVTFEAVADLLPAKRLHLPLPPGADWNSNRPDFGITHVYTNSDPIPQGVCTGALSACALVGFALESRCHTGQTVIYDAVGKLGWAVDIRTHRIGVLIDKLLVPDWDKTSLSLTTTRLRQSRQHLYAAGNARQWMLWPWRWHLPGTHKGKTPEHRKEDTDIPDSPKTPDDDGEPVPTTTPPASPNPTKSHVPKPEVDLNCTDCFKWEFFDDYGSSGSNITSVFLDL